MKTQRTKTKIAILSLGAFSLSLLFGLESCRKYEEGPSISFRSRKDRFINLWQFEKILINNIDVTKTHLADSGNVYQINITYDPGREEFYGTSRDKYENLISYTFIDIKGFKEFYTYCGNPIHYNVAQPDSAVWHLVMLKEDRLAFKSNYKGVECKMYLKPWQP